MLPLKSGFVMRSGRVAKWHYETMDVLYAAMPDDVSRAALVKTWHDRACGVDTRIVNRLIKELAGMWAGMVDECHPDFDLIRRWRRDHGIA